MLRIYPSILNFMRQSKKDATRLNKVISDAGFCSRREADELIEQERVTINNQTATQGEKVYKTDFIRIDGEPLRHVEKVVEEKRKPTFVSKRITRNLGTEKKKKTPAKYSEGKEGIFKSAKSKPGAFKGTKGKGTDVAAKGAKGTDKVDGDKKFAPKDGAKSKPKPARALAEKPEKKAGAAKKWYSGGQR